MAIDKGMRSMKTEIKYFQCEDCGFIIDPIEVKYSQFNVLEYCPRCKAYPQPFKQIIKEDNQ